MSIRPRQMHADGQLSLEDALKRPSFWYSVPERNE
jgi:hypothetical protein